MSDGAKPGFPAMSIEQAHKLLTAPGTPLEVGEEEIRGIRMKVWKNAPPTLREVYAAGGLFAGRDHLVFEEERATVGAFQAAANKFAHRLVADGVKPNEKEAIAWLKKDTPEVAKYLNGLQAERIATAFGHAGIRMAAFPHLLTDGTVLPKDGFKTKKWNEVPLIMTTGTDEFSLYTRINPYFTPSVKDKTVFTDEKKYAEFTFSKKYGSEMYRLFNAEACRTQ